MSCSSQAAKETPPSIRNLFNQTTGAKKGCLAIIITMGSCQHLLLSWSLLWVVNVASGHRYVSALHLFPPPPPRAHSAGRGGLPASRSLTCRFRHSSFGKLGCCLL